MTRFYRHKLWSHFPDRTIQKREADQSDAQYPLTF